MSVAKNITQLAYHVLAPPGSWTQGVSMRTEFDEDGHPFQSRCLTAALHYAQYILSKENRLLSEYDAAVEAISDRLVKMTGVPRRRTLSDHTWLLITWNDNPQRKHEDVLNLLKETLDNWEEAQ